MPLQQRPSKRVRRGGSTFHELISLRQPGPSTLPETINHPQTILKRLIDTDLPGGQDRRTRLIDFLMGITLSQSFFSGKGTFATVMLWLRTFMLEMGLITDHGQFIFISSSDHDEDCEYLLANHQYEDQRGYRVATFRHHFREMEDFTDDLAAEVAERFAKAGDAETDLSKRRQI